MKTRLVTAALAAMLSAGTITTAPAMPRVAPAADAAAQSQSVVQVGQRERGFSHWRYDDRRWNGRRDHDRRDRGWRDHQGIISGEEAVRRIYHQGYSDIRNMHLEGRNYVMEASGRYGRVRLVVDGRTGRVIHRNRLHREPRPGLHFQGRSGSFSYFLNF